MKAIVFILTLFITSNTYSWGSIGHRVVARIAELNLDQKTKDKIKNILGKDDLVTVATFPDFVKADKSYDHYSPYHYVSIDDPKLGYEKSPKNPKKDIIWAIDHFRKNLKSKDKDTKKEALTYLVHLVGDIHQPLHVGYSKDRGGNTIKLKWFGKEINLHSLWDDVLIEFQKLSYTEYADFINRLTKEEKKEIQNDDVMVWAKESIELRDRAYDYPKNLKKYWEYEYNYKNIHTLNDRLNKAGLRLAYLLKKEL